MIELANISVTFGNSANESKVLKNISLTVANGEFLTIMGKSGCGKTTLLNVIGGIIKPTSGTYLFNNSNVMRFNNKQIASFRNKRVGFIVQNFALINEMTVFQNIMLPLIYGHIKINESKRRVCNAMEAVDISRYKDKFPTQLSGGERQRVAIARSIAADTQVILADEPTGALDEENGRKIIEIFKQLNKNGKTIIMVTHDSELAKAGSRIITIKDGKIISNT